MLFISLVRLPGPGTVCFGETPGSQNEPEWGWSCSCTLTVASGGPSLLVELMGEQDPVSWMIRVEELRITSSEDGTERNWTGLEAFHHEGADREGYLVFEDMNFDGFMDLRLMKHPTAGPNTYWLFWLYSTEERTLLQSLHYNDANLVSPVFDPETRRILSSHRDGMGMYGTETYEVVEDIPVMLEKKVITFTDSTSSLVVIYKRVGDRMVEVERRLDPAE